MTSEVSKGPSTFPSAFASDFGAFVSIVFANVDVDAKCEQALSSA